MFLEILNFLSSTRSFPVILIVIVFSVSLFLAIRLFRASIQEIAREREIFVSILLNEEAISVPKNLAVEIVDALDEIETNDVAIEIYQNQGKNGWVDLKIQHFIDEKKIGYPKEENYIITATRENFGDVITKYLLWR